jgi:CBS domain-containing protein
MKVKEIMTAGPRAILPGDTVRRAADVMRELNIGAVPVVEDLTSKRLSGIITDRDIAVRCSAAGHAPTCFVRQHMTAMPLQTIHADDDVSAVFEEMERAQVRRLPVVTPEGILVGIVAQADLATKVGPAQPGEIEKLLESVSTSGPVVLIEHA